MYVAVFFSSIAPSLKTSWAMTSSQSNMANLDDCKTSMNTLTHDKITKHMANLDRCKTSKNTKGHDKLTGNNHMAKPDDCKTYKNYMGHDKLTGNTHMAYPDDTKLIDLVGPTKNYMGHDKPTGNKERERSRKVYKDVFGDDPYGMQ